MSVKSIKSTFSVAIVTVFTSFCHWWSRRNIRAKRLAKIRTLLLVCWNILKDPDVTNYGVMRFSFFLLLLSSRTMKNVSFADLGCQCCYNKHVLNGHWAIAKVWRSPAKRTKSVSLEIPSLPQNEQKFALQASTLRQKCIQNTIWSPKCDIFEIPTLPNDFCLFHDHWASENFWDGPLLYNVHVLIWIIEVKYFAVKRTTKLRPHILSSSSPGNTIKNFRYVFVCLWDLCAYIMGKIAAWKCSYCSLKFQADVLLCDCSVLVTRRLRIEVFFIQPKSPCVDFLCCLPGCY